MASRWLRSPNCGRPADETKRARRCRSTSAGSPILLIRQEGITERVHKYRAAGITTLLAKLEGEYSDQLTTLERLLDTVNNT